MARTPDGDWYQIQYPDAPGGLGWASSQFIVVGNKNAVATIPGPDTGSTAEGTASGGTSGVALQQINVRKGPGTSFDPVGTLDARDPVVLTGRDPAGEWLQLQFPTAPGGLGWAAAQYIQASGVDALPILGAAGAPGGTTSPGSTAQAAPTRAASATPAIAGSDGDSAQAPAASASFGPAGAGALLYSGDLSAPTGDPEDYLGFTTSSGRVVVAVACDGSGTLQFELTEGGSAVPGSDDLACGSARLLTLLPGKTYILRLFLAPEGGPPTYLRYSLRAEESR
jgi:hypothetical protein